MRNTLHRLRIFILSKKGNIVLVISLVLILLIVFATKFIGNKEIQVVENEAPIEEKVNNIDINKDKLIEVFGKLEKGEINAEYMASTIKEIKDSGEYEETLLTEYEGKLKDFNDKKEAEKKAKEEAEAREKAELAESEKPTESTSGSATNNTQSSGNKTTNNSNTTTQSTPSSTPSSGNTSSSNNGSTSNGTSGSNSSSSTPQTPTQTQNVINGTIGISGNDFLSLLAANSELEKSSDFSYFYRDAGIYYGNFGYAINGYGQYAYAFGLRGYSTTFYNMVVNYLQKVVPNDYQTLINAAQSSGNKEFVNASGKVVAEIIDYGSQGSDIIIYQ